MPSPRILYYGTDDEMRLGDQILVRRWLREDLPATVTHIPGESDPDPNILDHHFGYETGDGHIYITDHDPVDGQLWRLAPKGFELVGRAGEGTEASQGR